MVKGSFPQARNSDFTAHRLMNKINFKNDFKGKQKLWKTFDITHRFMHNIIYRENKKLFYAFRKSNTIKSIATIWIFLLVQFKCFESR